MKKNLTEIIYILDRSGSMASLADDTIGGYNSLLEKQRRGEGEAVITTVLFDDQFEIVHDRADIRKIDKLTEREYYARGCTALLDAVGRAIAHVDARRKMSPDDEIPEKTMVVITTDGLENASREYTAKEVKALISRKQEKEHWEFLFLGANIDAVGTAGGLGIRADRAVTYEGDSEGTAVNFEAVSEAICRVREARPLGASWKSKVEAYRDSKRK